MHPPAGKLMTFFDITPIPIATIPIPNIAFDLLLASRDFIEILYLLNNRNIDFYYVDFKQLQLVPLLFPY